DRAPKAHMPDLLADVLDDTNKKRGTFEHILLAMAETLPDIDTEFVLQMVDKFVCAQKMMVAVIDSAEALESMREQAIPQVQELWTTALRDRARIGFDPGLNFGDFDSLYRHLAARETNEFT